MRPVIPRSPAPATLPDIGFHCSKDQHDALLDDAPLIHDDDLVGVDDCRQAVRNHDDAAIFHKRANGLLNR